MSVVATAPAAAHGAAPAGGAPAPPPRAPWRRAKSRRALAWWLVAGATGALAFFLLGHLPLAGRGFSFCAWRRVTGIPCPGCGMTRAMAALARGELGAALHLHPFAPLVLAEAAALWGAIGHALSRGGALVLPSWLLERLVVWQGAAFIALWLGRLATGTLPW
ncbi:MAG TPA: DUF2752 domain-containing protein [Thermoanaerobaculia bacterium]|nr:DUF2752 domain-containing protein [Thermoanaerobaculia bacterium]